MPESHPVVATLGRRLASHDLSFVIAAGEPGGAAPGPRAGFELDSNQALP